MHNRSYWLLAVILMTATAAVAQGRASDPVPPAAPVAVTTNLLFPFVTNQSGFDTGLMIANSSDKPGKCELTFLGRLADGSAASPSQTTAVVPPGGYLAFTLSGGSTSQSIAAIPGFQGYMMAFCQFQFAHGSAFITDGFGGVPTKSLGYLALVVPEK